MASSWQLEVEMKAKKYFRDRKMYLRKVNMKYGRLIVYIRHDSVDIWGFMY
jgi:hypothetical protein